jgi:hypothetical protein
VPGEYQPGHRLGYLSDAEYKYVDKLAFDLHLQGSLLRRGDDELEIRFRSAVPDSAVRDRLIAAERKRASGSSRTDLVRAALDRLERDRR